jgi:hypothetical protein
MEETMTYVVEIEDKYGRRAVKEYDASSAYDLVGMVRYELKPYPEFKPVAHGARNGRIRRCISEIALLTDEGSWTSSVTSCRA